MTGAARVLLLTDPAMAGHRPPGHPERPERLDAVASGVADGAAAAGATPRATARSSPPSRGASSGSIPRRISPCSTTRRGRAEAGSMATPTSARSRWWRLAWPPAPRSRRRVAAAAGEAEVAFAVVRPPGHHARRERAAGFCLLNNVAVAVLALRAAGLAQRIAILDWDVHHGDGTQAIFDADPDLLLRLDPPVAALPRDGRGRRAGKRSRRSARKHNVPLSPGVATRRSRRPG